MLFINGGQTGVDRAVLDFAVKHNFDYCGEVCNAEDLTAEELVKKYPKLTNSGLSNIERTKRNIENSDWLVCVGSSETTDGDETVDSRWFAMKYVFFDPFKEDIEDDVLEWYYCNSSEVKICVGGARESWNPGIYDKTFEVLEKCFENRRR